MIAIHMKLLAVAGLAVGLGMSLSGCAGIGGAGYQVENATGQPIPQHALADEVFLDGTGHTARRMAHAPVHVPERIYAAPLPAGAPAGPVVRTRPTAIERADNLSSTTGSRSSVREDDPNKPFSDQWWEKERREDARLKRAMNICNGC